jgi:hypothetical protein
MATEPESRPGEIRITVDGGEFYSLLRAMKRGFGAKRLGKVVMSVRGGKLTVESARGDGVFACSDTAPVVARLKGGEFLHLASLVTDAKASGPLVIVFHPEFGAVSLPLVGAKAKFDKIPGP